MEQIKEEYIYYRKKYNSLFDNYSLEEIQQLELILITSREDILNYIGTKQLNRYINQYIFQLSPLVKQIFMKNGTYSLWNKS